MPLAPFRSHHEEFGAPLERISAGRFVYGVSGERSFRFALESGARAGAVAAAAVTGAMFGFGLRAGIPSRPFNAAAALVMGNRARGVWGFVAGVSFAGELVIIATCVIVGSACAVLLQFVPAESRVRHPRLFAFTVALAAAVGTLFILIARAPDFVGASPVGALSIVQGAILSIVVSVAYASGMGIAR